jgi:glycosyltransferase involved in cell wall biosynthesis
MNSILNQLHRNIEIILVDDGSTDDSGQQAAAFALRDERRQMAKLVQQEMME